MFCNLKLIVFVTVCFEYLVSVVLSHGSLLNPVNRASLWRFTNSTPPDYDENQGFCGGFQIQWAVNKGNCGICGDDYRRPIPRAHENRGYYGRGIIVANYSRGATIEVTVLITANHLGWYQFSLCPLLTGQQYESEECFQNVSFASGAEVFEVPENYTGLLSTEIVLPKNVTCDHCVLRWHYRCGNNWGICADGRGQMGCGPQETFRSCSDISIH